MTQSYSGSNSINPANGEVIARYPFDDDASLNRALDTAQAGFRAWAATPVAERLAVLARVAQILRRDSHKLGEMAAREMGNSHRTRLD